MTKFIVWTGPDEDDWADSTHTKLEAPVPPTRWPYGPPILHDDACILFEDGLYCDCSASDASEP